jgi:hypothetical protein
MCEAAVNEEARGARPLTCGLSAWPAMPAGGLLLAQASRSTAPLTAASDAAVDGLPRPRPGNAPRRTLRRSFGSASS